jgi:hypothetical protein
MSKRRKTATERAAYRERKMERLRCERVELYLTENVVKYLSEMPHPKIDDCSLKAIDYVDWLLKNGRSYRAYELVVATHTLLGEPLDETKVRQVSREIDNVGVPRTYR